MSTEHGQSVNFRVFALLYLNSWWQDDSRFVNGLRKENKREDRLRWMPEVANYYRIARNFKIIKGEVRLDQALKLLDGVGGPLAEERVNSVVCNLAEQFGSAYNGGKNLISAASKFLWIRYQNPIVIYDSRARRCVEGLCGRKLGDYEEYRSEWLNEFGSRREAIALACDTLVRVKEFSFAHEMADEDLSRLVRNRWFHERVFDQFLWEEGAGL